MGLVNGAKIKENEKIVKETLIAFENSETGLI